MRHSDCLEGIAYRIRPVQDDDAAFIVKLRSTVGKNRFINRGAMTVDEQLQWLATYYQRLGDYYFVIENRQQHRAEGLISLYDVNAETQKAEWGRWVLQDKSLAAIESVYLIYQFGFEVLGLAEMYCRTLINNEKVVFFHEDCGLKRRGLIEKAAHIEGVDYDALEQFLTAEDWPIIKPRLMKMIQRFGQKRA